VRTACKCRDASHVPQEAKCMASKSVHGVPDEGCGSLYVRNQPVTLVQMLNTKAWMQKPLQKVLNLHIPQR